ncbi:cytochrome P450 [Amycolatopsis sp. WQ 127309]|uniref:cytochrome P450 n=1 Tax=Amycolatopsis sp. WQ 127309 TaxID=2932773 RepID=UPI001FF14252|nr:cytochrome P450 [Amycolatopsis sp. WQ 127309]UOZ07008.1 cytochrome P450 [Amycolatopsis sp. WQ 127309]
MDVTAVHDPDFGPLLLAVSFAASSQAFRDERLSRAASGQCAARRLNGRMGPDSWPMLEDVERARVRQLLGPSLSQAEAHRLRPAVREIADELADTMASAGPPADLVRHWARPLPARVAALILGLDESDSTEMTTWAEAILAVDADDADQVAAAVRGIAKVSMKLWHAERRHPRPDTFTGRLRSAYGDSSDARRDFVKRVTDIIVGACENSMVFIQTGVVGLLSADVDGLPLLHEHPELVPSAVEELLRVHPPGKVGLLRTAVADTEIRGHPVAAGTAVLPMVSTANVDPAMGPDAGALNLHAPPRRHLTFGAGSHYCPGASIARMEMRIVLEVLAERWPTLALAMPLDELEHRPGHIVDGYTEVPLVW